jgi:hypothetical protein
VGSQGPEICELRRGFEQQPALQGAGGDLDEGVFGDEAKWSRHACISASDVAELLRPKSGRLGQRPREEKTRKRKLWHHSRRTAPSGRENSEEKTLAPLSAGTTLGRENSGTTLALANQLRPTS